MTYRDIKTWGGGLLGETVEKRPGETYENSIPTAREDSGKNRER